MTEPPSPAHVSVNETASLTTIDSEPAVALEPDQLPEAVQLVASVVDQLNVIVFPRRGLVELVLKLSVGSASVGGGGVLTVTVTLSFAVPPSPLHVML